MSDFQQSRARDDRRPAKAGKRGSGAHPGCRRAEASGLAERTPRLQRREELRQSSSADWWCAVASLLLLLGTAGALAAPLPKPDQVILAEAHRLGDKPDKLQRDVSFPAEANTGEVVLQISHQDVTSTWSLLVNGRPIDVFPRSYKTLLQSLFPLLPGTLTNGQNVLTVLGAEPAKAMSFSNVVLFRKPLSALLKLQPVIVTVTDDQTGQPVPARLTITDGKGESVEIFRVASPGGAVRNGLFYTSGKETRFELPEGRYEIHATRGMEWSLAHRTVSAAGNRPARVDLRLRRQVDTTGFIAADTHIHTVTFSGHGDATIDERMLTIAGEGVELAVAADHNHHTDYRPYQEKQNLDKHFTPVTGNEVTTKNGHFIAFPMPLGGEVPDFKQSDWVKLVNDMRLKGARVVILNHPRWPDEETNPFTRFALNRATGDRFKGPAFTFDAMEVVNSSSPITVDRKELDADQLRLLADWFAILNRGERITAVGSSDSHTVFNPVGQGRTYIRSSTDEPTRVVVDELCRNFLAGDTSLSYGIFAEALVNGRHRPGETVRPAGGKVEVKLRVASADWVKPRRAIIFLNGLPVAEKKLQPTAGKPFDQWLSFSINLPAHDAYLVCGVFGDPVVAPYWKTAAKFTTAIANPVYLDNDGDAKFSTPRDTARKILAATDEDVDVVWSKIMKADDTLAGQMLGLLYLERPADFVRQLDARVQAAARDRELFSKFLENSPLIVMKPAKSATDGKAK